LHQILTSNPEDPIQHLFLRKFPWNRCNVIALGVYKVMKFSQMWFLIVLTLLFISTLSMTFVNPMISLTMFNCV
jgi:hypothetical protein